MNDTINFIYLHGFASGPRSYKAQFFKEKVLSIFNQSVDCPNLNLPSFNKLTLTAQIDFIENECKHKPTFLIGSSLGAYLALILAQRKIIKIIALIVMAPAFELIERKVDLMGIEKFDKWKKTNQLEVFHHYEQITKSLSFDFIEDAKQYVFEIKKITQPILLFHGMNDDIVDFKLSQKYLGQYKKLEPYYIDSDHLLIDKLDYIWSKSERFIKDKIREV